ncbi:GGDEF domain-containing protein [Arcobacteraceae bacterium]|jgi:diguanylate cyclase (GGDEF)-like protein|nr:GGDEF domain-containing protein [Arcobacteraceae bacterium]
MKTRMLNLIQLAMDDKTKLKKLEGIYDLYDQLQYSENLNEMANTLFEWLENKYDLKSINFSLFDLKDETTSSILKKGEEFYLDGEFTVYFIVNTHTEINAIISFNTQNETKYNLLTEDKDFLDAAFFQISPILQNGIMKKHHIEASSIDSVTNVHNRKYLIEHIHKIISLSNKKEENISFLMIGIDRFKAVIDEFDYDIGDKVLIELAKVIHKSVKDFDIVARLTGDEFLVALVNLKSNSEAENIAKRIINEFAQAEIIVNENTNQILKKTICIGISSFPEDSNDINQVLKNADSFLNEARNNGRGEVAIYKEEDNSTIDLF